MKQSKNTKVNANYFTKTDTLKIAGIITVIVSAVEFFFGWSYIGYLISCAGLAVGVVLFIVGSSGRVSETEITEYITKNTDGACEIDIEEKALSKRVMKLPAPLTVMGFVFKDGVMLKKSKKGTLQSSIYSKAILYALDTSLLIRRRTLLIAEHEVSDSEQEIPYADIKSIELTEETEDIAFGKKVFRARKSNLAIETNDGTVLLIPAADNVESDAFISDIRRILK